MSFIACDETGARRTSIDATPAAGLVSAVAQPASIGARKSKGAYLM
ncbi:hypothetical protein [Sphingopyxis sp. DBS4]|nr:hypothetical protein [Sphingopyxis sp. DBS4]